MVILGIETSCDETAAAVVEGSGDEVQVLADVVSSQINIHRQYGGVVPEVAAREHVAKIIPVVERALSKAGIPHPTLPFERGGKLKSSPFAKGGLDAIAVTVGPGLVTSLLIGVETAKSLALAWDLPLVAVNHIEGHIYANFIGANSKSKFLNPKQIQNSNLKNFEAQNSKFKAQSPNIKFPSIILTVSGGHTMLVLMEGHGKLRVIGDTQDDAAGEAFDKAAAMLGLGYPGGPAIATAAVEEVRSKKLEVRKEIILPRPMINSKDFNFSFSGLKTALLYAIQKDNNFKNRVPEYAREFQQAVIDVLISKTIKAAKKYNVKTIMLAGGVSANRELRSQMTIIISSQIPNSYFLIPDLKYTTDNAAMIATAGYFKARRKKFTPIGKVLADCNIEL
jgi:N6-L-threonylcarbamoyladenine synthase